MYLLHALYDFFEMDCRVERHQTSGRLEPAAAPVVTAAADQKEHDNDEQNCRNIHSFLHESWTSRQHKHRLLGQLFAPTSAGDVALEDMLSTIWLCKTKKKDTEYTHF
jgi:hypothetical protein